MKIYTHIGEFYANHFLQNNKNLGSRIDVHECDERMNPITHNLMVTV